MHPDTTYEMAKYRQHDLLAEADNARLAKEARAAAKSTEVHATRPSFSLRGAASGLAARVAALTNAPAAGN